MNQPYWENSSSVESQSEDLAQGLQRFMTQTFTWMALGLGITGFLATFVASQPGWQEMIFGSGLYFGLMILELVVVIAFMMMINRSVSFPVLLGMFLFYSALNGVTLSSIFMVYDLGSINQAFFTTAGTFGAMSLYGYVTKRDLSGLGSFMIMGLIGMVIAGVINIFLHSSLLNLLVAGVGVLVFVGLAAYDTQKLKAYYASAAHDASALARLSLQGALMLYLDFVNLFLSLLRLLGNRR